MTPASRLHRSVTEDYRLSQTSRQVSLVHQVIRDREFSKLPDVVSSPCADLLWESYQNDSSAMHTAAGRTLPVLWWVWLLKTASPLTDNFIHQQNALGQSAVDLWCRTRLNPLPWQGSVTREISYQLNKAMQSVLASLCDLQAVRDYVQRQSRRLWALNVQEVVSLAEHEDVESENGSMVSNSVKLCRDFYLHLELLARATGVSLVELLCRTRGTSMALKVAIHLFFEQVTTECYRIWATCPQSDCLRVLQEHLPPPPLPAHLLRVALFHGKRWARCCLLYDNLDLHCVVAAACPIPLHHAALYRARGTSAGSQGLVSLWNLLSPQMRRLKVKIAEQELGCERLTTLYEILRAQPSLLASS